MKCVFCKETLKHGTVPFHIDRNGIHVTFDSVPALVCGQCGKAMFEAVEVRDIEGVIEKHLRAENLARLLAPAEQDVEEGRTRPARAFLAEFKRAKKIPG